MTDFKKLHEEARKIMLERGRELEEKAKKLLKELEKEIVYKLSKQPKTEFQAWNLLEVWKGIEEVFEEWKKERWLKTFEEEIKETYRLGKEQALKVLKESFKEDILDELRKYVQKGEIRVSFRQIPDKALKYVLAFPYKFAGNFSEDLKERVREKIFLGIASGKSYLEIARELDLLNLPTIKPFKSSWDRAKTIARTETARAYHLATFDTYKEFGVEEIEIICGKNPCKICLSHCGTIKPLSYADEVLKHPNCTCTYVAVKRKGKVYDKKSYKMEKEITKIKEYTLEKSKHFVSRVINDFAEPIPDELIIPKFKNMFKSEKDFYRHLFKHGIPEEWKLLILKDPSVKLSWTDIKNLLEQYPEDFKRFTKQYFMEILQALAYLSRTFYELPFKGAKPNIILFSGYRHRVVITLQGEKLQSSYVLRAKLGDYIKQRKEVSLKFVEAGVDEELRNLVKEIRNIYKRLGGNP